MKNNFKKPYQVWQRHVDVTAFNLSAKKYFRITAYVLLSKLITLPLDECE